RRAGNNQRLAEVRYNYDLANNLTARQYLHRAGRTDLFAYDTGNRLVRAEIGTRPVTADSAPRTYPTFSVPQNVPGQWAPGFYGHSYSYTSDGLDVFAGTSETNPDAMS